MDVAQLRSNDVAATLTSALAQAARDRGEAPQRRLERLYETCRDDVYSYLASVLGDRGAAEEITAAAFERAFRRHRLYNPRRGSERAWLFGIARNAALDELRRRRRSAALPLEPPGDPGDEAEGAVRRATVQAALRELGPRERELVALKFHAGLSNAEIARVLRISESNAGTLLHRTITKLREACDAQR
jgi:RNA polymerase sigma-70 factor, ECF subfamily